MYNIEFTCILQITTLLHTNNLYYIQTGSEKPGTGMINPEFLTPEYKEAFLSSAPIQRNKKLLRENRQSFRSYSEHRSNLEIVKSKTSVVSPREPPSEPDVHWLKAKALGDIVKARKLSSL